MVAASMQPSQDAALLPRAFLAVKAMAAAYAAVGLWMMFAASPKVPYADPYRFLANFLTQPFPANVFMADNGHREVLPNAVRIAELAWFDANQYLQILVGFVLAVLTLVTMIRAFRHAVPARRVATSALLCIGIFWLGNTRKLAHGNESVHLFLVLLCTAIGLRGLCGRARDDDPARSWAAAGAGFAAVLSFGGGPACFAAFFVVLALQRAPWRTWAPIVGAAALGAIALLFGGAGANASVTLIPLEQLEQLLRWIAAPFVWALSPILDSAHAARLPTTILSDTMTAIASPIEDALGPHLEARWPSVAIGGAGLFCLLASSWRSFRRRDADPRRQFALGLAWFGLAVGMLVVLLRPEFFRANPEQVTSQRYVPWAMMFWTGLALGFVLAERRSARGAVVTVLAIGVLLAPSQIWTGRYAFKMQRTAEVTAIGAAVGVIDRDFALVETQWRDLIHAVPLLQAAKKAMFAWPETARLGTTPTATELLPVPATRVEVHPVPNRFPAPGCAVRFHANATAARLLLLDAAGTVRGLAVELGPNSGWQGWLRGQLDPDELRVASLR